MADRRCECPKHVHGPECAAVPGSVEHGVKCAKYEGESELCQMHREQLEVGARAVKMLYGLPDWELSKSLDRPVELFLDAQRAGMELE